ncbi:MAG TPA: HlyD family secretion protein [Acetobacteraceae bacterium]
MAEAPTADVMVQRGPGAAPSNPARPAPRAATETRPRRRLLRPLLFAALPVALVVGGYFYVTGGQVMSTENAYVQADMVGVSTDVAGIVREVAVHDNQRVAAGDVLYRLDDQPFRLALTRAEALVGNVRNDLTALKSSYRDMQTQIGLAQVDIAYYDREFRRQQDLAAHQASSQVNLDNARHNLQTAQQRLASLNQQLAGIAANLSGDPEIPVEKHPRMIDAVAQRDEAARQLAHAVVRAPMDGVVTNVPSVQPGQYLAVSTPALSVVATDHVWIEASPKETELTYVRPGQRATVTVDTYPDQSWEGSVDSISPASGSSFSLLPAQNTTGNWVKVVQRIPMRVRIETPSDKPPLRVGMSVVVDVDTGHPRGVPTFLSGLFGGHAGSAQANKDGGRGEMAQGSGNHG